MPSAQELEFGRLVVEQRLATPEMVRECFALQASQPQSHIGQLLIARGVLDQQRARELFELARQRAAHPSPTPAPTPQDAPDRQLGQALLQRGWISQPQLAEVYSECQALRARGQAVSLAQLLLQYGLVSAPQLGQLGVHAAPLNAASGVLPPFANSQVSHGGAPMGPGMMPSGSGSGVMAFAPNMAASSGSFPPPMGSGSFDPSRSAASASGASAADGRFRDNDPLLRVLTRIPTPDGAFVLDMGDYEVIEEVARGGMGIVYRGRQRSDGRVVAIKAMKGGENASEKQIRRFQQEAEATTRLQHPNIVAIHDVGCYQNIHFYTMDLVEGGALDIRLKRGERPTQDDAVSIVRDVARAIQHAHELKIIHRDLKPANILFDLDDKPYVTDFGLAKNVDRKSMLTRTGAVVGTPYYMPPEQARGNTDIDARCDIYALGIILYELLTGRPPFRGETAMEIYQKILEDEPQPPSALNRKVSRELDVIVMKAIAKRRERRYQSAEALATDLDNALNKRPIAARPPGFKEKFSDFYEARQKALQLAAITLLLLIGLGAGGTWVWLRRHRDGLLTASREAWVGFIEEGQKLLRDAEQAVKEAEEAEAADIALKRSEDAQLRLDGLLPLVDRFAPSTPRPRLELALLCLDGSLKGALFEGDAPRESPDTAAFLESATSRAPLYGFTDARWTPAQLLELLAVVRAGSVDPEGVGPNPQRYKLTEPLLRGDLPRLHAGARLIAARWRLRLAADATKAEDARSNQEAAAELLEAALRYAIAAGQRSKVLALQGRLADQREDAAAALAAYDAALEADPKNVDAALARGRLHARNARLEEAAQDFGTVIDFDFKPFAAYFARGRIRLAQGQPKAALEDFKSGLSVKVDSIAGYIGRGLAYLALEQFDDARDSFTEAVELARREEANPQIREEQLQALRDELRAELEARAQAPALARAALAEALGQTYRALKQGSLADQMLQKARALRGES